MQGGVIYEDLTVHHGITLQNTRDLSERGTVAGRCLALEHNTRLSPVQINAEVSMLKRYVHVQDMYSYKPTQFPARRILKMCRS